MSDKLRELGLSAGGEGGNAADVSDDGDPKDSKPPLDQEFEVGLLRPRLDSPHLPLPDTKDTLFVT